MLKEYFLFNIIQYFSNNYNRNKNFKRKIYKKAIDYIVFPLYNYIVKSFCRKS